MVAKVADYVDVMYAGKIVETGTIDEIFYDPRHPYTWGLLSAMPDLDTADERLYTIPGSPPNLLHEKPGDAFAARNRFALNIDEELDPPKMCIRDRSNGDPVTANDFVFGWQRAVDPATASEYSYMLSGIGQVVNAADIIAGTKDVSELGVTAVADKTCLLYTSRCV